MSDLVSLDACAHLGLRRARPNREGPNYRRAALAALAGGAALLAASGAQADPERRPYGQWHADLYMLHFSEADLRSVPVHTSVGPLTGRDIGVGGVRTLGFTLYTAPHVGLGFEIPNALFYLHGGAAMLGWGTGEATSNDGAGMAFAQFTAAARVALGSFVLSLGPSVGPRYLWGSQAGGWTTGVQPTVGGEFDARIRILGGRGKRRHPPTMTLDIFIHLTATAVDGTSWMVAFGEGWGSLPGR